MDQTQINETPKTDSQHLAIRAKALPVAESFAIYRLADGRTEAFPVPKSFGITVDAVLRAVQAAGSSCARIHHHGQLPSRWILVGDAWQLLRR